MKGYVDTNFSEKVCKIISGYTSIYQVNILYLNFKFVVIIYDY